MNFGELFGLGGAVQIAALIAGAMFMAAAKVFEAPIKGGKYGSAARWFAFGLSIFAGLCLAVGLIPIVRWFTGLGTLGAIPASIGTILTVLVGWQAVYLVIAAIRDLMDRTPDEEARKAARWVPTFLPVGGAAIFGMFSNPRADGLGLGVSVLTAAIVSAITMAYTFKIFKAVDLSKNGKDGWKWFAAIVAFLAGFIHVALINYVDGLLAEVVPGTWMGVLRALAGLGGILLMACGIADILRDGKPDKYVRRGGVFGVPLVTLFFSLGVALFTENAESAIQYLSSGGIG
jgi:hypothetical protein